MGDCNRNTQTNRGDAVVGLIERLLPDRIAVYNGVAVRSKPWYSNNDHYPDHKELLVNTVREYVSDGDWVKTVGGGHGVAEVHAARVGGDVVTYEAAYEMVQTIQETAYLNNVNISVRWATIGTVYDAYGTTTGAKEIKPKELVGDVLILDCEGAEMDILPQPSFDTVIVETHPRFGADTELVINTMSGDVSVVGKDPIDGDVVVRNG